MIAVSSFEGQPSFDAMPVEAIASINGLAVTVAKQIYSAEADFVWQKKNEASMAKGRDLLAMLKQRESKGENNKQ